MMIYHNLLFIFVISCKQSVNSRVVIYVLIVIHRLRSIQPHSIFVPQIFIPDAYGMKNRRRRKPAQENGVNLLRRFLERVVWI